MAAKPTLIFVPGAWHTDFHVTPVLPLFEASGYRVITITLWTNGVKEPPAVLEDNVALITKAINQEVSAGRRICILGHSAGALPSAMAINDFLNAGPDSGKAASIERFIIIAAFLSPSKLRGVVQWIRTDETTGLAYANEPEKIFYNDMPLEKSDPFVKALVPAAIYKRPDFTDKKWYSIPRTYLMCLQDHAVPPEVQREQIENYEMDAVELDAGHCPFVSQPEKFVRAIERILVP